MAPSQRLGVDMTPNTTAWRRLEVDVWLISAGTGCPAVGVMMWAAAHATAPEKKLIKKTL